jgi:putative PIG3 family NAD(P)H quinone oxidoreductase
MKAVVITGTGGAEVLEIRDVPRPHAQGDEVLVRVCASGINRAVLMQARGHYPAPPGSPADIPGLEFAGEVVALGARCTGSTRVGDRVFGIVGGGGLAEYVVTPERMVASIPPNLDFVSAAAVPEAFITAHDALEARAELRPGESVLIHAVGGGVGSAAVQLAHAMGCFVIGTSRTDDKLTACAEYGLDVGIDTSREDFADVVLERTGGIGVRAVIDHLGAPAWAGNVKALASQGCLVLVGLLGGSKLNVDLSVILRKRLRVVGTTLRARPLEDKIAATRRFAEQVVPWLERGLVRPIVDQVYPLAEVASAQVRLESNLGFGKVVLVT